MMPGSAAPGNSPPPVMFALLRRAPAARLAFRPRFVATTRPRFATSSVFPPGVDAIKLAALQSSPLFKKIKENPAALEAVAKFAQVMQSHGAFHDQYSVSPNKLIMGVRQASTQRRARRQCYRCQRCFSTRTCAARRRGFRTRFRRLGSTSRIRCVAMLPESMLVHGREVLMQSLVAGRDAAVG